MRVRLLTTMAGPSGNHFAGSVVDLAEDQARDLIAGGYAVEIVQETAAETPQETATDQAQETAAEDAGEKATPRRGSRKRTRKS